jgi:hypothetical protein
MTSSKLGSTFHRSPQLAPPPLRPPLACALCEGGDAFTSYLAVCVAARTMSDVSTPPLAVSLAVNCSFGACFSVTPLFELMTVCECSCCFCLHGLGDPANVRPRGRVYMVVRLCGSRAMPSPSRQRVCFPARVPHPQPSSLSSYFDGTTYVSCCTSCL